jgi:hypothetical protein
MEVEVWRSHRRGTDKSACVRVRLSAFYDRNLYVALLPASFVSYHRNRVNMFNVLVDSRLLTKLALMSRSVANPLKSRKSLPYHHIEVEFASTCIVARKRSLTRDCLFECSDGTLINFPIRDRSEWMAWWCSGRAEVWWQSAKSYVVLGYRR